MKHINKNISNRCIYVVIPATLTKACINIHELVVTITINYSPEFLYKPFTLITVNIADKVTTVVVIPAVTVIRTVSV